MFKLFATNNLHHLQTLKTLFRNPQFYIPISHLHSSGGTLNNPAIDFILNEVGELQSSNARETRTEFAAENAQSFEPSSSKDLSVIQILHPWPEWVELMELLLKGGYFDGIGNPFKKGEMGGAKDSNQIRTACLNFGRDRFDLIRYFSRKDIQVVTGSGCPSTDRKVVNSGKCLRAHVGLDERNVCSTCILRGNCERAYVKAREDEGGRTVDVMRFLLTYGLDPITGSVENKPCLNKRVKESVRRLLKEMVEFSMEELDCNPPKANPSKWNSSKHGTSTYEGDGQIKVPVKQGDWICPKCNFRNFARNIRCLRCDGLFQERLRKLGEDQERLPLKKGDWICDKCNFLNFAKNTSCLQCKEKPPKRQLNPGEWECDSCNYINFRRNAVCLKCDHRRPKAANIEGNSAQWVNDNGWYHHSQAYFGQERHNGDEGVDMWNFVEDNGKHQDGSDLWNEVPGLVDFPIAGGKSNLSRNLQNRERWKMEMLEKSRSIARARENADDFKSAIIYRTSEFLGSTDDEEMAEWFGHEKRVHNLKTLYLNHSLEN